MYVAGIDLGSVAAKAVIMDGNGKALSYVVADTKPDFEALSWEVLDRALTTAELRREDLCYIVGTGYGRNIVPFANVNRTEIMCHALGVNYLFPTVRTIIDIGGQDSKVIRVTSAGGVEQFVMNERCAAGAGRFIVVISRALRMPPEKWGEAVKSAPSRAHISSTCTVFAESEVISLISQKVPVNEIVAGLCESLVHRVYQMVVRLGEVRKDVCFTGGVAQNEGVVQVLGERLGVELFIPDVPQFTGALGAAVLARRLVDAKQKIHVGQ